MKNPVGQTNERGHNPLARVFCCILALLVITGAIITTPEITERLIKPIYLGVMLGFFLVMGLGEQDLRNQGWRFLVIGLSLLFLTSLGGVLIQKGFLPTPSIFGPIDLQARTLEHGVGFLLGFSVLSFGFVLWVPEIVRSQKILKKGLLTVQEDQRKTTEKLRTSMRALDNANDNLIQAERLAAVGELAAGIAHDLRNPLAIIRSAAQAGLGGQRPPEEMKQTLQVIKRSVDKADRTIKGLLQMGRPAVFSPSNIEADELIHEVIPMVRVEAKKKEVHLEVCETAGAVVWGDKDLIAQVLINLCLNAIQATPPGGTVKIGTRNFRLGGSHQMALFVEDTGDGIPPDVRQKIFDPFFTTKADGTGLGLTMCQRVAARHGGRLMLSSMRKGGARALLLLAISTEERIGVST